MGDYGHEGNQDGYNESNNNLKRKRVHYGREPKRRENDEAVVQMKKIWETVRITNRRSKNKLSPSEKHQQVEKLIKLMQGRCVALSHRRDASRIVQTVLKYGNVPQRRRIYNELKPAILELSKDRYAVWVVLKMFLHGERDQKHALLKQYYGNVRSLATHKEGARALEFAFNRVANAQEKVAMQSELYAQEFAVFKDDRFEQAGGIEEYLKQFPEKTKSAILQIERLLVALINKGPQLLSNTVVHKPIIWMFSVCTEAKRREVITIIQESANRFIDNASGMQIFRNIVAYGNPKCRKTVVKSFRQYVKLSCQSPYATMAISMLLSLVDDTKLLNSVLTKEIAQTPRQLITHPETGRYGCLPFLCVLAEDPKQYIPLEKQDMISVVTVTDQKSGEQVPTSRKDPEQRKKEIRVKLVPPLWASVVRHPYKYITSNSGKDVVVELLKHVEDGKEEFLQALANLVLPTQVLYVSDDELSEDEIVAPSKKSEEGEEPAKKKRRKMKNPFSSQPKNLKREDLISHPIAHRALRQILEQEPSFADMLLERIGDKDATSVAIENTSAAFVFCSLLKFSSDETKQALIGKFDLKKLRKARKSSPGLTALYSDIKS